MTVTVTVTETVTVTVSVRRGQDPWCVGIGRILQESRQADEHEADQGIKMCCSGDNLQAHTIGDWKLRPICPRFTTHEFKQADFRGQNAVPVTEIFRKNKHVMI